MGNTAEAIQKEPEKWSNGEAVCPDCKHEWIAQAPVEKIHLDCPECKSPKAVFKYPYTPSEYWICGCGRELWCVKPGKRVCRNKECEKHGIEINGL